MPDLYHSLLGHDLGHLRIIAGLWGIEIKSEDAGTASKELSASLFDPGLVAELINSLSPEARAALNALVESGGRIPWAIFTRQFGDVREMGAGKRDRERPYLNPVSVTEVLFYRALLARAFFATDKGPQEFAFIPDDLVELIRYKKQRQKISEPPGRAATPAEKKYIIPADDRILDDATTLLAALRLGHKIPTDPKLPALLNAAALLKKGVPQAGAVKSFLETSRLAALKSLMEAWKSSETFNELRLIPNLMCEGEWTNQPLATRQFLTNLLEPIPQGKWWNMASVSNDIKVKHPDFQRPAGDYDSWFIKRASDGQYLRGFDCWDEVDGALIRFFIMDILHWLGMVDLASPGEGQDVTAFRMTGIGTGESEVGARGTSNDSRFPNIENGKIHISSQGKITAPRLTPRAVRYQLARFCEWEESGRVASKGHTLAPHTSVEAKSDEYKYRITPQSLTQAREQGLKVEQLLALLAKHSEAGIPPSLVKALKRWEVNGTEAHAETQIVLRVSKPEILEQLRKSKASRFLGEPLGPTAVVLKAGAQSKVMNALAEMGLLAEDETSKTSEV